MKFRVAKTRFSWQVSRNVANRNFEERHEINPKLDSLDEMDGIKKINKRTKAIPTFLALGKSIINQT